MRTVTTLILIVLPLFLFAQTQSVSINNDGSAPDASALLDVKSTTKGMLVPRMTSAQRGAISSPATSLLVFDTDTGSFWFHSGSVWQELGQGDKIEDSDRDTKIQTEESPDEDEIRFDVAGLEMMRLDDKTLHIGAPGQSIFVGSLAGESDDGTFNQNTFLGFQSGRNSATGFYNSTLGRSAGYSNTVGSYNTFLGYYAGYDNISGSNNTFVGRNSGDSNTTASNNTFFGSGTGENNTIGHSNTFVGRSAGNLNVTGHSNTFIGYNAGSKNTAGLYNTFVGYDAGLDNTTGWNNTFVGYSAGDNTTTGSANTFSGRFAGHLNTTGWFNAFYGYYTGYGTTGDNNAFFGSRAGESNTSGMDNTFLGFSAGNGNTTASQNTMVGFETGYLNATGAGNVFIGYQAGYNETGSGKLYIDNSNTSTPLIYGDFGSDQLGIARIPTTYTLEVEGNASKAITGPWEANSDARLKKNIEQLASEEILEKLLQLQGVTYEWDDEKTGYKRPEGIQYGFTAQNIREVFPSLVSEDALGYLQTAYSTYDAMYIEAIKALVQKIHDLENEKNSDQVKINELESRLNRLEQFITNSVNKGSAE